MNDWGNIKFPVISYLDTVDSYVPGVRIPEVVARYGIPAERVIKLASAENPLGPSPMAVRAIENAVQNISLYPDWRAEQLRDAIAQHNNVRMEQVIASCGETELISQIIRAFSKEGDEILFPIPTFPIYEQTALVERRQPIFLAEDLNSNPEKLIQAVTKKTKVVILTSPNNPLSTIVEQEALRYILDHLSPQILVLLDEAYIDYSETGSQASLLHQYNNLVILRTFSKIYGLAGLRVGYGMAHKVIIQALMKMKPTWNIGILAIVGATAALEDKEHYEKTRCLIQDGRDYLIKRLSELSTVSVNMKPQGNFLCLQILDPTINSTDVFEGLLRGGVIVKDCSVSYRGLGKRFIRVDVSLKHKMDQFLNQLAKVFHDGG
ncbi:histidinol-phosphate transaminase [Chloroflexota bacterium]